MSSLTEHFPPPFLNDLVAGRVLPIVGSGFSRNAITPSDKPMPLWDELGRLLAKDLLNYPYSNGLDAISAYAHDFTRLKLVERLFTLLMVNTAKPGKLHQEFCSLPFQIVCTTNFDFLLETQYAASSRYCCPILDEDQLSHGAADSTVTLLKLHGDLNHPQRLVVTEDDYDRFLTQYPLLSTFVANLLITRTPLLIGYSLDDPDLRQLWRVIIDRLGPLRRPAYALTVDSDSSEIARFDRRGIKVISLAGKRSDYSTSLAAAFKDLGTYWSKNLVAASDVTEEALVSELSLPETAPNRLCYFAVPLELLSQYKEYVFPIATTLGFIPMSSHDVISPGDSWVAKVDTLISRAAIVVIDVSSLTTKLEGEVSLSKLGRDRVIEVATNTTQFTFTKYNGVSVLRPEFGEDQTQFLQVIRHLLTIAAEKHIQVLINEPRRLYDMREYRAAVISAFSLLEATLRDALSVTSSLQMNTPLHALLIESERANLIDSKSANNLKRYMSVRNFIVHGFAQVSAEQSKEVVEEVERVLEMVRPR